MKYMQFLGLGLFIALGAGCSGDTEIAKSEALIQQFKCSVTSLPANADFMDSFSFNAMQNDKDKANFWLSNYKKGMNDFNKPISEVIEGQLKLYQSSCESLGGHLVG